MASLESNAETAVCAVLNASAGLTNFQAVPKDSNDAQSVAKKDRLVVNCAPREVELRTATSNLVAVHRLMVTVEVVYVTRNVMTYDAIIAAVEAALGAAEPPAPALTAWIAAFPYGARLEASSEGSDETGGNTRERTKSFVVFVPTGNT